MNITLSAPGLLFFGGLTVTAVILLFYILFKKEKGQKNQANTVDEYNQLIQDAQTKAKAIIEQAGTQATTMISQTQTMKQDIEAKENDVFKKITDEEMNKLHANTDEYFKAYQASLNEVKAHYIDQMNSMLSQMQSETEKEIQELKEILKSQVTSSEGTSTQKIQADFAKAQIEIAEYKKHKLQEVDQSINDVLVKVSGVLIGKIIPVREHQKLIVDALEQAKKEGMFQF